MTPLYLNPPSSSPNFPLTKDDHLHHHQEDDHQLHLFMINSPLSSQTHDLTQTHFRDHDLQHDHQHKVNKSIHEAGSFSRGKSKLSDPEELHSTEIESNGSAKWKSSKVRLMRKMISSDCSACRDNIDANDKSTHDHEHINSTTRHTTNNIDFFNTTTNNSTTVRVCSDCNTTTTPLWRSGPRGPKSLCNACGIRQRKARRAMAEAANRAASADHEAGIKTNTNNYNRVQNKDKKPRTGLVGTIKKQCKQQETVASCSSSNSRKKLCFKDFALSLSNNSTFQRVFPKDEEEAAILLMELSCGLVHS